MYNFILRSRPLSYNSCRGEKKVRYKTALEASFVRYNPKPAVHAGDLYAVLFHFFKTDLDLDTDNISKPVWDCLCGFLYTDDKQIRMRTAGSFDLGKEDFNIIDFTGLSGNIVVELLEAFEREDHVVYIECGAFSPSMIKFNLE